MNLFQGLAVGFGAFFILSGSVTAQEKQQPSPIQEQNQELGGELKGFLSAGAGLIPDYKGSQYYEPTPYFDARLNYGNYYARFEGGNLRLNVIDSRSFHAGPIIGIRRGRDDSGSAAVSRMNNIDTGITHGGFIEYEHIAQDRREGERVTLSVVDGNINQDGGLAVTLQGVVRRPVKFLNPGLIASFEADVTWANRKYMQTYFGVNASDALTSGLPVYRTGSGFESVGTGFALDQFLSPKWSVGLRLHYARLTGNAADSPITAIEGTPNQFFAGLVIGYVIR